MANYSNQTMPYAQIATIITPLTRCDQFLNLTQTIQHLYDFYRNNATNPFNYLFANVSLGNYDCNASMGKYYAYGITFTRSVSVQIQVSFASVYYDYLYGNQYFFDGFYIEREERFNLSSITLNNQTESDACSSATRARDSLCPRNSSTPYCNSMYSNPWIFNCSRNASTYSNPPWWNINTTPSPSTNTFSGLTVWQIGLICGLSFLFLLFLFILLGCLIRRHIRSKRINFSSENLFTDMKNSGVPQVQAFQQVPTIAQPRQTHSTAITRMYHEAGTNLNNKMMTNRRLAGPHTPRAFVDHAKVHDPTLPPHIPRKSTPPIYNSYNRANAVTPKTIQPIVVSRPVSGTSTSQLRSIIDGLAEDTLDESDSISLDRSSSTTPKKPSTPLSRQFFNMSSVDESLHDDDAWMSILAVANAELDVLNRLENDQTRTSTPV